tara:strand:- start:3100 stop:3402 length:303 start_codon:yes stop_codon:yes gene_type:complete
VPTTTQYHHIYHAIFVRISHHAWPLVWPLVSVRAFTQALERNRYHCLANSIHSWFTVYQHDFPILLHEHGHHRLGRLRVQAASIQPSHLDTMRALFVRLS